MPVHSRCRICRHALPEPFLDLGMMPLANAFLSDVTQFDDEPRFPLAVAGCRECGLVQLTFVVPAEQLYRNYIYVSSTSDSVRVHARWLAAHLVGEHGWGSGDQVVEVASNDGTVLKAFQQLGVRVLGVEPARNIAAIAEQDGVPTVAEFFGAATARDLRARHGPAALVLARHVFAHVDDVHDFFEGIGVVLREDGLLVIEVPYLGDLLEKREFDTVYHEHLSYIALAPMQRLCAEHGFRLIDVERIALHGGSILLHIRRSDVGGDPSERLERMEADERRARMTEPSTLEAFAHDVSAWKQRFQAFMAGIATDGGRLIGYGAAAKANTLLNYCPDVASRLEFVLDRSIHKQGKFTPGTHLRVEPPARWLDTDASHMVILAWNFEEEIRRQMHAFSAQGGLFVVPIPEPRIVQTVG